MQKIYKNVFIYDYERNFIMKKFINCIIILCILINTTVFAQSETISGTNGSNISYTLNRNSGEIIINGSGALDMISGWDSNLSGAGVWAIKKVIISEGITSISDSAFFNCYNVEEVIMPNGITTIGKWALSDCKKLKTIQLPATLKNIDDFAFCFTILENLDLPDSVQTIGESVFPSALKQINVSENNMYFSSEGGVLYNKNKTKIIEYLSSKQDEEYIMPDTVESIDFSWDNKTIKRIKIGEKFCSSDKFFLEGLSNLENIEVDTNNVNFSAKDGILYDKMFSTLICYPENLKIEAYRMPNTVLNLGGIQNKNLLELTLSANLSTIPQNGIVCSSLKKLYIPKALNEVLYYGVSADSLTDIYYEGNQNEWKNITIDKSVGKDDDDGETIGNAALFNATIHYNYKFERISQYVIISNLSEKTYGDSSFTVSVTNDSVPSLGNFTFESSNTNVAEITAEGVVTIKNAGETNITVKRDGNDIYAPFEKTQKLVVKKVPITVTADAKTKKVGTADPALTYTYTGTLAGADAFTGELTRQPGEEIGKYDILQGTLTLGDNYDITYNKAVFEILDKTPQTITVADFGEKTYGDGEFAISVTPDSTSNLTSFTYASDNEAVATISADGKIIIKGAGEANITVTEAGSTDYAAATVTKKLTVNKKALNIKVDDVTVTYGEEINTNITYDGFITGEDETVLTKPVAVSGYSQKPNAGEYDIVLSGAEAANYEIAYTNAKLIVNKKDITVTSLKVFDKAADETTTATISNSTLVFDGVIFGDDVTIDLANASAAFAQTAAGEDIAVTITGLALTGADAANYNLTNNEISTTASIKDSITAADIAAQINALTVVKDAEALTLPSVPAGYKLTIKSSDNEAVIKTDGSVAPVANDTNVVLVLEVANENDETDVADTDEITVTVPASTTVTVTVVAGENGTATGTGDYLKNAQATVTATPNSGYNFDGWYNGETRVSTSTAYAFKVENDITLTAKFARRSNGGGGGGSSVSSYTVKFETNGGSKVSSQSVSKNSTVKEPTAPTKDGFEFAGWYSDKDLKTKYDFSDKVTKSITLYAAWTEKKAETTDPTDKPSTPETKGKFTDVNDSDWFGENVKYVFENGLMSGVSENKFAPNDNLTRAMLVTILYRAAGEPEVNKSVPFADVKADSYYANAVIWAQQNGIVSGVSENEFAPDTNITREQIATIMFRYAKEKGYDVSVGENTNILSYTDAEDISEYAVDAMQYAVGSGLIKGKSETTLNPKDTATRAEIAAILQRFIEANK